MYIINNQTYTKKKAETFFNYTLAGCETILIDCVRIDFVNYEIKVRGEEILIHLDNLCEIEVKPDKNISFVFVGCKTIEINSQNFAKGIKEKEKEKNRK